MSDLPNESVQQESEVKVSSNLRWAVLAVACLGLLIFGLANWPQPESSPPPPDQEQAEANEPAAELPSRPDLDTTTSVAETGVPTALPPPSVQALGPLLDEPTELGVLTGNVRQRLRLTQLDTGTVTEYLIGGVVPMGQIGANAIVQSADGQMLLLDLDNPEDEGIRLGPLRASYQRLLSVGEDVVWVIEQKPAADLPVIAAYDVSGELVEEYGLESDEQAQRLFSDVSGAANLVQNAGGIYERGDTGYERVANGALLTSSEGLALVKQCDEQMTCNSVWYDRSSWAAPLDAPAPELDPQSQMAILGGDRWLVHTSWTDGMTQVVEIATGRVAWSMNTPPDQRVGFGVPISPDGRWLFDRTDEAGVLVDLENDAEYPLDLGRTERASSPAVFIEMRDLAISSGNR